MRFAVRERRAFCTGFGDAGQRPLAKVRKGGEVDRVKPVFFRRRASSSSGGHFPLPANASSPPVLRLR